jgi:hypothetical protein
MQARSVPRYHPLKPYRTGTNSRPSLSCWTARLMAALKARVKAAGQILAASERDETGPGRAWPAGRSNRPVRRNLCSGNTFAPANRRPAPRIPRRCRNQNMHYPVPMPGNWRSYSADSFRKPLSYQWHSRSGRSKVAGSRSQLRPTLHMTSTKYAPQTVPRTPSIEAGPASRAMAQREMLPKKSLARKFPPDDELVARARNGVVSSHLSSELGGNFCATGKVCLFGNVANRRRSRPRYVIPAEAGMTNIAQTDASPNLNPLC